MNWVGGSRNRVVMKNDAKKQREFFEKRKMQQKLKNLGIDLPASPQTTSSGSMDLVTLFIVNQIAAKKEVKDPPKVAVLGSSKGGSKHKRNEPLVLPMSPCSPSQLDLVEGQPQNSCQGTRKRKHAFSQGFKCSQLSPVLESAFSDNSASDYLPPITDPLSPFSSTSSASGQGIFPMQLTLQQRSQAQVAPQCSPPAWDTSGLDQTKVMKKVFSSGIFPMQLTLQQRSQAQVAPQCSPPAWDTSGLDQTKFQPFSQPRGMTNHIPWSCRSIPLSYQLETPTNPEPDNTEARDHVRHEVIFPLNQLEDREPVLDFTLNQSESEQQFKGDVFRGFSPEECETEAHHQGSGKSKIYLKDETPTKFSAPQTVPDKRCMEVEKSNLIHDLSNYSDVNFSHLEHNNGLMNDCEYSQSYSCRGGCLSSDSDDGEDEDVCEPCLQIASSCMDHTCSADNINANLVPHCNPEERPNKPRPPTPLLKHQRNIRDNQEIMENVCFPVKASISDSKQTGSITALFASPQSQSSELCKCKKTSHGFRDAGTQTVHESTAETCDASTQCSFVSDNLCLPLGDVSVQHPATGRQTDPAAELSKHTASPGKKRTRDKHMPWTEKKSRAGFLPGCSHINIRDGKMILQRPINPFLDLSMTDGRGKDNRVDRDERGQQESGRLMKDLSNEVREEVILAARANTLPEEAETLQEIADILLLLKQRKEARKLC